MGRDRTQNRLLAGSLAKVGRDHLLHAKASGMQSQEPTVATRGVEEPFAVRRDSPDPLPSDCLRQVR